MISYLYIFLTIIFTVFGQIVIKWQVIKAGPVPAPLPEKMLYLLHLLLNPWIIGALFAAFLASLAWVFAVAKLQLSVAYPFISLSFVLVLIASNVIFNEVITPFKIIGMGLIIFGIIVGARA